jgi:hypothetical protein
MSYIDMVDSILLNLLRSSREGNWNLHLFSIKEMIPWCFAYDKFNYARYLPVYYSQMEALSIDYIILKSTKTSWMVCSQYKCPLLSNTNTFGRIPVDQTTKMS